jgi:hypothetical protein
MRSIIRAIDRSLRKRKNIFEFCNDPDCVFRVSVSDLSSLLHLRDGEVPAGSKVLELHFWNEHIPPVPRQGLGLSWAVNFRRRVATSARLLGNSLREDPRLADVQAVGGVTPLFTPGDGSAAEGIFLRLGFAVTQHQNPLGRFVEFWEEVYGWLLMWAFSNGNHPRLLEVRRSDFWMSVDEFVRRYGNPGAYHSDSPVPPASKASR